MCSELPTKKLLSSDTNTGDGEKGESKECETNLEYSLANYTYRKYDIRYLQITYSSLFKRILQYISNNTNKRTSRYLSISFEKHLFETDSTALAKYCLNYLLPYLLPIHHKRSTSHSRQVINYLISGETQNLSRVLIIGKQNSCQ